MQRYYPSIVPDGVISEPLIASSIVNDGMIQGNTAVDVRVSVYEQSSQSSLLDFGDDSLLPISSPTPVQQFAPKTPSLILNAAIELSPQKYQQLWLTLPDSYNGKICTVSSVPSATQQLEANLKQNKVSDQ